MNKVFLYGNIGKDPDVRTTESGKKVAKFSLATSSFRKDKDGNKITEWHNIVVWDKLAELAEKYIKKGSSLIVDGEISYRTYTDKDGVTKHFTEIICSNMHFTGKKESEPEKQDTEWRGKKEVKSMSDINELPSTDNPDDLPF
jgi:single-strand DNA-binding protein